jgi:hypothetical protein
MQDQNRKYDYDTQRVELAFYYIKLTLFQNGWEAQARKLIASLNLNEVELRSLRFKLATFYHQHLTRQLVSLR